MKLAIVGSGVSGLVCAHLLHRHHDVRVYEANDWIGGHVNTLPVRIGDESFAVDTGFIVFNERTYPNFVRLLDRLGVASRPSDMSFALTCERTGLEYSGTSLAGMFAQRRNLVRPGHWRMLRDILRFHREAERLLEDGDAKVSLGDYLAGAGYGEDFVERHLLPMGAAIWSTEPARMREFPAATLVRFFRNHGLLTLNDRPEWRVVRGGSQEYVRALIAPFRERILTRTPVRWVRRLPEGGVELAARGVSPERFDQVILAVHADQALALVDRPTPDERRLLGAIRYQPNEAVLHTDASLLPRRRRTWASWNYRIPRHGSGRAVVTYWMNRLQGLAAPEQLCVTLNAAELIDPDKVIATIPYEHPLFDQAAVEAQGHVAAISGADRIHYCGAWGRYGFHEDGVVSALAVCERFGARL